MYVYKHIYIYEDGGVTTPPRAVCINIYTYVYWYV